MKKVKLLDKADAGRPKNYYVYNLNHFKRDSNQLKNFLDVVKDLRKYIPFAVGLPFSLLKYNLLQLSSVYLYSDAENVKYIKEIFSDYRFIIIKEASNSVLKRSVEFKQLPLLSLEDTILTALQDARNLIVVYALLKTQSERIDYDLISDEMLKRQTNLDIFASILDKNDRTGYNNKINQNFLEPVIIEKAVKNLLKKSYSWDVAISLINEKFRFIEEIR